MDVQRAVRYAIDYDGLAELVGGGAIKLPSIIQLGFLGALGPDAAIKTDVAKAKELMAKAGFPDGFKIDHETAATAKTGGVAHLVLAQKLQTDLAKIGIVTNIVVQDDATSLDRYRNAKTALGARGWNPDYPDAINQFAFCPGSQVGLRMSWKAEAAQDIADMCKRASVELDEAKRADMIKQIQLAIMDRGPYANLIQPGVQIGHRVERRGRPVQPGLPAAHGEAGQEVARGPVRARVCAPPSAPRPAAAARRDAGDVRALALGAGRSGGGPPRAERAARPGDRRGVQAGVGAG